MRHPATNNGKRTTSPLSVRRAGQAGAALCVLLGVLALASCGTGRVLRQAEQHYARGEYFEAAAKYKRVYSRTSPKKRAERGVLVGLSLDGGEEDNAFRVKADFSPAFKDVMRASEIMDKAGVSYNILSVVTGKLADNIERVYAFFKECGFKYLQFIPCLRPLGSKEEGELYMTNEQYAHFLTALFRLYVCDMERGDYVSIRRFDNWVHMLRGEQFEECGVGGFCTRQFVVEANGNVYPCDFYCLDKWLLGNINTRSFEQMARSPLAQNFIASSFIMPSRCGKCEYFDLCRGGGCKRARTSYDYCSAYKEFFTSAKEDFARLAARF